MQVILLCAGQSNRMQPIGDKILLEFCGKSLLEHQLENISLAGFFDFIIVGNKNNLPKIKKICKKLKTIHCNFIEQKKLEDGMKGAIEVCKKFVKKEVLIVNSNDIVENKAFSNIAKLKEKNNLDAIVCGKVVKNYFPGGYISIKKDQLIDIIEKPGEGNEPSNLVNIVLHYFKDFHSFFTKIEKCANKNDDAYELALKNYAQEKCVKVYKYNGYWQAIKYPWHILDAQKYFLEKQKPYIHKSAIIAKNAIIKGNVFIDKDVKIFENAIISGPCYIGKNCVIANNSLVRESNIGENSVIGFATEVARSFLYKNIWTHTNYIGDSVIDENVSFGAGSVTGNLRLDEKNIYVEIKGNKINSQKNKLGSIIGSGTRIGTQCSINPGIKIGKNVFLGSAINLQKNVENGKFVYIQQNLVEKENICIINNIKRKTI